MNIIKRYVVIEFGFFLCQYPEIIQIITRDNPFHFGADIVFAVMWFWFPSYAIWNNLRICTFILRNVNLLPHLSLF